MRPLRRLLASLEIDAPRGGTAAPQPAPVSRDDLAAALDATRPTVNAHSDRYVQFEREFGSV